MKVRITIFAVVVIALVAAIFTFNSRNQRNLDLNGKNVVPFATSEGSGLGNFDSVLSSQYPNAKVLEGHFERGKDVADRRSSVESNVNRWLNGLGY
ncbi:hypothetical protein EFS27_04905 [Leuconostoc mesenteroides]|uniref:flavodoxin n=1 Tax=Leuconostoc TaxID=1243 RepID=UPI0021A6D9F1|nr:flavodoxin [Leuconostoc mesenteroides]MCT3038626.1 hypothetical protein [Leuconostoc mesenteroides]